MSEIMSPKLGELFDGFYGERVQATATLGDILADLSLHPRLPVAPEMAQYARQRFIVRI